ncbi:proto-oncogene tyrosine-protein kinase ROS-like protein [Dinothrombium tinctorium]|uniref:Tyrosine-protein kinase receptor n=1 Tax=Dinothrombium tinctorium TaxID=1965070 RepID=A0A443R886_9ACAR|nr:proto-oncogene tyrosine-protein kinase ROS-like protein [Dinothrombium tinctorium]RWS11472.1 proto-oncogene tyrosine-protein kinase ROS-like protein [Dinothrombium tinctorium]
MKAKIEKLQVRYCKFGCNQALNVYVNEWRKRIGSPAAPELVAGSLTNVSLILKWEKHSEASNISYLVQLQNVSLNSDWLYYRPERTFSFSRAHVKDLHPYTKYRFRVAWIIHPQFPPVFSLPSLEIVTAAYGEPSTPPVITSLVATGPTHISVSWEPPPYPNGPLIAYMLYLFEGSNTTHAKTVKEISLSQFFNTTSNNSTDQINQSSRMHHIFSDLKEGTLYTVSVSCVNTEGEGPSANESVATLNSTSDSENFEKAYAVIASDKSVSLVPIDFMSVADKLFRLSDYSSNDSIISIAVHVAKNLLFVSDTNACVRRVSFEDNENIKTQTILKSKTNSISKLSVDWLNDMLYLLEGSNICRCNLNGRSKHIVVTGFKEKVYDMHVDPYNGYLYWSYSDFFESGIYRIDISRFQTSPVRYREAECIYKDQQFITVFTIDYSNFRLYFPTNRLSEENTIISLTLSGIDSIDIRKNKVVTPQFNFVNSVVYFNETFYWTVGHEVYKEEYHNESNIFYHNSHTLGDDYYGDVRILHSRMQPYPLPHNTVEKLEAIFSETIAKVSWKKPALLGGMAQGAWQRWTYDIAIEELSSYNVTEIENINQTSCVLEQLKTNTTYKISVRASSAAGKGPWSAAFIGTTLNKNNNNVPSPYILWTTKRGLFRSNMIGDEIELLFDAKKFNYSSMKDYFVECSLLNGQDHRELFKVEPFSGKQIIGLTLNHDHKEVYWIVRESNDFMLYKLDLLTGQSLDAPNHFLISSSDNSLEHVHGSLWYFDQRFFLHYHKSVLVTDLKARNVAFLRPTGLRDVETIEIVDESARFVPYLDEMDLGFDIVVVPNPVNASSIRINVKHEGDEKKVLRDADLVQLPELPSHHHENNAHYFSGDAYMDEELSSIPQLAASQIKLNKFLGSGAFADVYEGIIYNFNDENSIKVAIKTLRNGASESQKNDFLKEAKLMKNFKHRHILQLLAICLDNSPILIFELMEGGDLLSYLRKNRPDVGKNSSLTMNDLLNISIDVAKGCKYLEEMHYVHRDLATRNCLVSSYLRCQRVVKIGDFGLARDIYKHDYYRKDGEGLLPVRWMAPESIVDGIFTTQSDIWSFGVLLWEVLTLGQRPYPARDNVEVLNFVKSGGRLEIPKNCPNQLVKLLKQCWHHQPENRPTFGSCLKRLEQIRSNLAHLNVVITSINNQSYALQSE